MSTERKDTVVAVVPARMASSRFPGKPLAMIAGLPMVEHVRRRAGLARTVDRVVVATCDKDIMAAIQGFDGAAVMTRDTHERCTDRVQEAMESVTGRIVVIVQGDEPLLDPATVDAVVAPLLADPDLLCTNLVSPLSGPEDLSDPDVVKACCDLQGNVIYLTRAAVPFPRSPGPVPVYRQTGIMAFRTDFLHKFSQMAECPLERMESVDMLRVLEHGYSIRGVLSHAPTVGVDRPEDLVRAERLLAEDPTQRALFESIRTNQSGLS